MKRGVASVGTRDRNIQLDGGTTARVPHPCSREVNASATLNERMPPKRAAWRSNNIRSIVAVEVWDA